MSATFAQAVFFSSNSDTSLALQTNLFDSIKGLDHPEKGRFGSHFLLFPLLGVNKHFRKEVAKYLFKHVFMGLAPALENAEWKSRSKITLQRWTLNGEGYDEQNDPRFLWTNAAPRRHKNPPLHLCAASCDESSLTLEVTYKLSEYATPVLSIATVENPDTGREFSDVPAGFVMASSAAFTHASEELQLVNKDLLYCADEAQDPYDDFSEYDGHFAEIMLQQELGYDTSDIDRWGLRSAVPLPTEGGYKIDYTKLLIPKLAWPCTADPKCVSAKDEILCNGYTISYSAKQHDEEDFMDENIWELMSLDSYIDDEDDHSAEAEARRNASQERFDSRVMDYELDREEEKEDGDTNLIAFRVEEIRAPMMSLLKPPVTTRELNRRSDNERY